MAGKIMWRNGLGSALESALNEGKLVLVEFFSPT